MFAQELAISSGRERITASIISSAVRDKLGLPRAVLDTLKTMQSILANAEEGVRSLCVFLRKTDYCHNL
jgi:hypothetical protein